MHRLSVVACLLILASSVAATEQTSGAADRPIVAQPAVVRPTEVRQSVRRAESDDDSHPAAPEALAYQEQTRRPARASRRVLPPTRANIAYGPHDRNVLDLWEARSDAPAPLLVCIHGGGFLGGDRSRYYGDSIVSRMLDAGISVVAINYRLTDGGKNPYPIPMHDGARAIQYLRHHADRYNLDPMRVAATGGSAGACMSMWIAFHEDLADPEADDPVLRESTRLTAIAPHAGQPILHPQDFQQLFRSLPLREHPALRPLFGIPAEGEIVWNETLHGLMYDASPITHLTADDPPVYLTYGEFHKVDAASHPGVWVHHPLLGVHLKRAMDELEVECHLNYPGIRKPPTIRTSTDFLIEKLTAPSGGS